MNVYLCLYVLIQICVQVCLCAYACVLLLMAIVFGWLLVFLVITSAQVTKYLRFSTFYPDVLILSESLLQSYFGNDKGSVPSVQYQQSGRNYFQYRNENVVDNINLWFISFHPYSLVHLLIRPCLEIQRVWLINIKYLGRTFC